MAALIESEAGPMAPFDLAAVSRQLAEDVGRLVPDSDGYTVEDYFTLDGNYLVEFDDGRLQVLPMPDGLHQSLVLVIAELLNQWLKISDPDGRRKVSPFKVFLDDRRYCEPDVCYMLGKHAARRHRKYWEGADVVFEIISETNRRHDVVTKVADYAAAGFPEYWIIDPESRSITLYVLRDGRYEATDSAAVAVSRTLPGFQVVVSELFARAEAEE